MKRFVMIAVAVVIVAAIATGGYLRSTENVVRNPYSRSKGGLTLSGTGFCANADLRATVRARTAPSGLLGWSGVQIVNPLVRAAVQPCAGEAFGEVKQIIVTQRWVPRSCRLQVVEDDDFGDPTDASDDDLAPWRVRTGECGSVPVGSFRAQGAQLQVVGDTGVLDFNGRIWDARVCFTPTVEVQAAVVNGDQSVIASVSITLPDACVSR